MKIIDDVANFFEIDLHLQDEQGDAWLEVRDKNWVIKRFIKEAQNEFPGSRTRIVEIHDKKLIIEIISNWLNKQAT